MKLSVSFSLISRNLRQLRAAVIILTLLGFFPLLSSAQSTPTGTDNQESFTAKLINLEAASSETFRFNASLHNGTAKLRLYQFSATMPEGWMIAFKVDGSQVSSLNLDPGKTQNIVIEVNPSNAAKPGKFAIPVKAVSEENTLTLNLEAVVKGSYKMELTTPTGRLSDEVTSGSNRQIQLEVRNTGTIALEEIKLSAQAPSKWEASFEPVKIDQLEPGKTATVTATLTVPDKTIAGDYETKFSAKATNADSDSTFRITVKTSLLSGWIGILVILLAIALIYYLIKKYGRR